MNLKYKNVYVIHETICRASLADYFWPAQYKNIQREALIAANKKDAWFCHFLNNGLTLDIQIIINKHDYTAWEPHSRTRNLNTIKSELKFYEDLTFSLNSVALKLKHPACFAEDVRKKIYVSHRFQEKAEQLWAAQYFDQSSDKNNMYYELGFNRDLDDTDRSILSDLKAELSLFEAVSIL